MNNEVGLHVRLAANFVQTAAKFKYKITVVKDGKEADEKSIFGVLPLVAGKRAKNAFKTMVFVVSNR